MCVYMYIAPLPYICIYIYYAFCYLLPIYSLHYYFGILHGYPCNITNSCLRRAPTGDRTRGLLTASQKRYRLSYAGPRTFLCLKIYELNNVYISKTLLNKLPVIIKKVLGKTLGRRWECHGLSEMTIINICPMSQ